MRRKISTLGPRNTKHDPGGDCLNRILNGWQDSVGKRDVIGEELLGIGTGNLAIVLIEQLNESDLAAFDGRLKGGRYLPCRIEDDADQRCIGGLYPAIRNAIGKTFRKTRQTRRSGVRA